MSLQDLCPSHTHQYFAELGGMAALLETKSWIISYWDMACRARWDGTPLSRGSMEADLARVADRAWAAEQCLNRTAPDAGTQAALLQAGLVDADAFGRAPDQAGADTEAAGTSGLLEEGSPGWWRCRRLQLLSHVERLQTLLDLHNGVRHCAKRCAHCFHSSKM